MNFRLFFFYRWKSAIISLWNYCIPLDSKETLDHSKNPKRELCDKFNTTKFLLWIWQSRVHPLISELDIIWISMSFLKNRCLKSFKLLFKILKPWKLPSITHVLPCENSKSNSFSRIFLINHTCSNSDERKDFISCWSILKLLLILFHRSQLLVWNMKIILSSQIGARSPKL